MESVENHVPRFVSFFFPVSVANSHAGAVDSNLGRCIEFYKKFIEFKFPVHCFIVKETQPPRSWYWHIRIHTVLWELRGSAVELLGHRADVFNSTFVIPLRCICIIPGSGFLGNFPVLCQQALSDKDSLSE